MNRLRQKLKDIKGETIAEALIASFLAGIGLLILATMIRVSHKMIDNSNNIVNIFYEEVNQMENLSIIPTNGIVTITDSKNVKVEIPVEIYETDKNGLVMYIHKYNEANSNENE